MTTAAERDKAAEVQGEDPRYVHEVDDLVDAQADCLDCAAEVVGAKACSDPVRKDGRMSEGAGRQQAADGEEWVRRIVEGEEQVATRGEDAGKLAETEVKFGLGFEVVEGGNRNDAVEATVIEREGPYIRDAGFQERMAVTGLGHDVR